MIRSFPDVNNGVKVFRINLHLSPGMILRALSKGFGVLQHSIHGGKKNKSRSVQGPVHMNSEQHLSPEQVSDPEANFALVYGLKSVTVHISFLLPGATSREWLPVVQHCSPPCRGNFSPCEQNAKVALRYE